MYQELKLIYFVVASKLTHILLLKLIVWSTFIIHIWKRQKLILAYRFSRASSYGENKIKQEIK